MQFTTFDNFFDFFDIFSLFFFIFPLIFFLIVIGIFVTVCRAGQKASSFTVQAPSFVIPDRHQGHTRSDGTEIKTVRLPDKCPSCGASLSHEDIDWVGPLEAKCNYCGSTVKATFERI
jgi:hypothetical protein